jgi:hypothetical protein
LERDFDLSEDNEAAVVWELVSHLSDGFTSELLEICVAMSLQVNEGSLTAGRERCNHLLLNLVITNPEWLW